MSHFPRFRYCRFFNASMLLAAVYVLLSSELSFAQNSLGLGQAEQAIKPSGFFAETFFWIQQQQKAFYRSMTQALSAIRSGEGGGWLLIGLSFAYGVLHAAGPGHGKIVISSYMVANEMQLRRGIFLSVISSLLQAIVAILAIGSLVIVLHGLGLKQMQLTRSLEMASYLMVTLLGAWLLWRKTFGSRPAHAHSHDHNHHGYEHDHHRAHGHNHTRHQGHAPHDHEDHGICETCGHAHMPDPKMLERSMGIKETVAAVFSVGLRPCTGALIVLSFAFLNGLYLTGIAAAIAMAFGTAITVSAIASVAVLAKTAALRLTSQGAFHSGVYRGIEISGAFLILAMGFTLLSASLYS